MPAPGGFILANDYGQTHTSRDDKFKRQRFGFATFVGVNNFALLKAYFGEGKRWAAIRICLARLSEFCSFGFALTADHGIRYLDSGDAASPCPTRPADRVSRFRRE